MKIVSTHEMREIESIARSEFGFHDDLVIENVGRNCSEFIFNKYLRDKDVFNEEIIILCGKGNNGADGFAIGRNLVRRGLKVRAFMLFTGDELSEELSRQMDLAINFGVKVSHINKADQLDSYLEQNSPEVLIDAIFGTGVRLPLSNFLYDIIKIVNHLKSFKLSIDIPSGVDSDSGQVVGNAIKANATLAIGVPKLGHFISDGPKFVGKVRVIDAGFPGKLMEKTNKTLLTKSVVAMMNQERSQFSHKNSFGHTLVIGGSTGLTGALLLAANAALKVGSGLVTALTWETNYAELASRVCPEIMTGYIPLEDEKVDKRMKLLNRFSAVVIGPGFGQSKRSRDIVHKLLSYYDGPIVVDADAINVLQFSKDKSILRDRRAPTLFTPHLGEFSRFMKCNKENLQNSPLQYIKKFIEETNCSVLLKGPCTYIGCSNNELYINYLPNAGMATGGSGDVLAGIIGGLYAQNEFDKQRINPMKEFNKFYQANCLGAMIHSLSGKKAATELGERAMVAGDIIEYFSDSFKDLKLIKEKKFGHKKENSNLLE